MAAEGLLGEKGCQRRKVWVCEKGLTKNDRDRGLGMLFVIKNLVVKYYKTCSGIRHGSERIKHACKTIIKAKRFAVFTG
jgi:hypothetical protein